MWKALSRVERIEPEFDENGVAASVHPLVRDQLFYVALEALDTGIVRIYEMYNATPKSHACDEQPY